jgi:cell division protein ZapA
MAALNIPHELLHKHDRLDAEANSAREHVRSLLERVDSALAADPNPTGN